MSEFLLINCSDRQHQSNSYWHFISGINIFIHVHMHNHTNFCYSGEAIAAWSGYTCRVYTHEGNLIFICWSYFSLWHASFSLIWNSLIYQLLYFGENSFMPVQFCNILTVKEVIMVHGVQKPLYHSTKDMYKKQ